MLTQAWQLWAPHGTTVWKYFSLNITQTAKI